MEEFQRNSRGVDRGNCGGVLEDVTEDLWERSQRNFGGIKQASFEKMSHYIIGIFFITRAKWEEF